VLNTAGDELVLKARAVIQSYDNLQRGLNDDQTIEGQLKVGAIPTTLTGILPPVLVRLREHYPKLHVNVTSGLSAELITQLSRGYLDAALITQQESIYPGLTWTPIISEKLVVAAPRSTTEKTDAELLESYPFIRLSRSGWGGRQIDAMLRKRRIRVRETMELDSLEAISVMIRHGLGVSVVPLKQWGAPALEDFRHLPFGKPTMHRVIGVIAPNDTPKHRHITTFVDELKILGKLNPKKISLTT